MSKQNLNNPECFPIVIDNNDPVYDRHITQCLTFSRATTDYQVANCRLAAINDNNHSAEQVLIISIEVNHFDTDKKNCNQIFYSL